MYPRWVYPGVCISFTNMFKMAVAFVKHTLSLFYTVRNVFVVFVHCS